MDLVCTSRFVVVYSGGQRAHTAQWITCGVGGALGVSAAVAYAVHVNRTHKGDAVSVTPAVGPTFASAIAAGRF